MIMTRSLVLLVTIASYCQAQNDLDRKLLLGYQGWFACAGDGSPYNAWRHWFRNSTNTSAANLHIDFWPDVREFDADELYPTAMTYRDGTPVGLYSCYNGKTVGRHFKWMRDYGIDGVYLQRFANELGDSRMLALRNQVLRNVRAGAEAYGRSFAIMYDISGMDSTVLVTRLTKDWMMLVDSLQATSSARYLKQNGRPVLAVWGLGFTDRPGNPRQADSLIRFFKSNQLSKYQAYLVGGVPTHWRTLTGDSKTDTAWLGVYHSFDMISPWTVGRYKDTTGADQFCQGQIVPDLADAKAAGVAYMPVVFPGTSAHHLDSTKILNAFPRAGGQFLWRQVYNALHAGCTFLYGAMFDEVDEGTAWYKQAETQNDIPAQAELVTLDADGYALPSDWYLRIGGAATGMLNGSIPLSKRMLLDPTHPDSGSLRAGPHQSARPAAPNCHFLGKSIVLQVPPHVWVRVTLVGFDGRLLAKSEWISDGSAHRVAPGDAVSHSCVLEMSVGNVTTTAVFIR